MSCPYCTAFAPCSETCRLVIVQEKYDKEIKIVHQRYINSAISYATEISKITEDQVKAIETICDNAIKAIRQQCEMDIAAIEKLRNTYK